MGKKERLEGDGEEGKGSAHFIATHANRLPLAHSRNATRKPLFVE